jgi:hypothetical protein
MPKKSVCLNEAQLPFYSLPFEATISTHRSLFLLISLRLFGGLWINCHTKPQPKRTIISILFCELSHTDKDTKHSLTPSALRAAKPDNVSRLPNEYEVLGNFRVAAPCLIFDRKASSAGGTEMIT